MAREFQVLIRNPGGALYSITVQSGESVRVDPRHSYRIIADGQPTLPDGTTIVRSGKNLRIRFAGGDELTILDWTAAEGATLDTRGARVFLEGPNAFGLPAEVQSGLTTPVGGPDEARLAATPGSEVSTAPAPSTSTGAVPPPAAPTPSVPAPAPASAPAPAGPASPPVVAGSSGGGGGFGGSGILLGVLGLGALAGAAGGGGGGSSSGGGSVPSQPQASTAPSDLAIAAASDSGATGDRVTNDNTPTLTGRADANAAITVRNAAGTTIATATADASGNWNATPANALPDGQQALQVVANRGAGAPDSQPTNIVVTIDTSVPGAPTLTLREGTTVNSSENSDGIEIGVSGVLATGDTVATILTRPDGTTLTTQRAVTAAEAAAGIAVVVVQTQSLQGSYGVAGRITDVAGNVGAATAAQTFVLDSIGPAAPVARLDPSSDSGAVGDNVTNDNTPTISGTGVAGDAIRAAFTGGTVLTTTVAANGTWSLTPTTALANGAAVVSVTAADPAGNVSPLTDLNLTIDATPPGAPVLQLDPSSDSGVLNDRLTNDNTPTISGTGSAGDTIRVTFPGGLVLSTTVAANGSWSVTPAAGAALPNGAASLTATATDVAGNVSPVSALTVTIDTVAPPVVSAPDLIAASDSGISNTDNLTGVTTPTFTGTGGEAGATVSLFDTNGTTVLGTAVVATGGGWSVTSSTLSAGPHTITARQSDPAGNSSAPSTALVITIDATAPAQLAAPDMIAASDSGLSNTDNITNVTAPTFTGSGAEAGALISLFDTNGTTVLGTATAAAGGTWSITSSALSTGPHTITARATDAAGNTSAPSAGLVVTIDTTPPPVVSAPDLIAASDSGASDTDNITSVTTPTFTGTGGEAGATVTLFDTNGTTVLGTATVASGGTWSVTSSTLAAGPHTITARETDAAGNISGPSTGLVVAILTSAPGALTLALDPASDSGVTGDNRTNDNTPTISGTGVAGNTVRVTIPGNGTLTTTVSGGGTWSVTPLVALADGSAAISATQTDTAGNVSPVASLSVVIDTTLPGATGVPDLIPSSDSGISNTDNVTNVTTPTFSGSGAEANATVRLFDTDGTTQVGSTTADGSGNWSITSSALGSGGHTIRTRQVDVAGNLGPLSSGLGITIDNTAPPVLSAPDMSAASDSGPSNTDDITNVTTPTFTGTGEAGAIVSLFDTNGTTLLGTATVGGGGGWSITSSALSTGPHTITARQTDAAGNTSAASPGLVVTIDTSAATLAAPDLAAASDAGSSNTDNITNVTTPTLTGTGAEPGATVTLFDTNGTTVLGTDVADGGGAWSITTSALAATPHTFTAKQTDLAGNTSAASAGLVVTIDTALPGVSSAPDLAAASDLGSSNVDNLTSLATPTFTGTAAEAGGTMTLFDTNGTTVLGTAAVGGGGAWSITSSALAAGPHTITARQTDVAGNQGAASPGLVVTIDTAGPTFGTTVAAVNEGFASVTLSPATLAAADNVSAQAALTVTGATFSSGTGFIAGDVTIGVAAGVATITRNAGAVDKNGSIVISTTMLDEAGNTTTQGVTISVNSVNDAPAGTDAAFGIQQSTTRAFSTANFAVADANDTPANGLLSVLVTTLPALGTLSLGGVPVVAGQEITVASITGGLFTYTPVPGQVGAPYSSFTFQVRDDGGTTSGGINLDLTPNTMTLNVTVLPPSPKLDPNGLFDPNAATGGVDPAAATLVLFDDGSGNLALGLSGDSGFGGVAGPSLQPPASGGVWNTDGLDRFHNGSLFVP